MPVKSKRQYGLMRAAANGKLKHPAGPSSEVAKEFLKKTPPRFIKLMKETGPSRLAPGSRKKRSKTGSSKH
jgi:hypothetical protein